jgi:prephenate dehydratase
VPLVSAATARVVAYLGGRGSFSEEACRRFVPTHNLMPMADFAAVAQAVAQGSADIAVLPVSNTHAGPIAAVHQLLSHPELRVVGEEQLGVRLHLLGLHGADVAGIKRVLSHPAALMQCARYLGEHAWERSVMASTAEAARQVALLGDTTVAAIASSEAAAVHGLALLAEDLQGSGENVTRFAIIERRDQFA